MQRSTFLLLALVLVMLAVTVITRLDRRINNQNLQPRPTGFTIDINTADADKLAILPAVGPSLAHRIVDYRTVHGHFLRVDDLLLVSGVGDRTLQRMLPFVRCGVAR